MLGKWLMSAYYFRLWTMVSKVGFEGHMIIAICCTILYLLWHLVSMPFKNIDTYLLSSYPQIHFPLVITESTTSLCRVNLYFKMALNTTCASVT